MRYLISAQMSNFRISAREVVISKLKIEYLNKTRLAHELLFKEFAIFRGTVALCFILSGGRYLIKFKTRNYNSLSFSFSIFFQPRLDNVIKEQSLLR